MLGDNLKVHFAGADGDETFYAALQAAGVNYRLYSCYKYIVGKSIEDNFRLPNNHVIIEQCKTQKHVIQDSGLFTLMFGAGKGGEQSFDNLKNWQDKLVKFVVDNGLDCTCVEIDCQKILGVGAAWYFRERMKDILPNRQINVFHYEDGRAGLDKLIEFSDYIAVSVPELRIVKPRTYKKDVCALAKYIKTSKPEIDIHLLGCTEYGLLEENAFCTSADSTSWLSGVKYGFISDGHTHAHVSQFKREIYDKRFEIVCENLKRRNVELRPKTLDYVTNASISATICKERYEKMVGNQD